MVLYVSNHMVAMTLSRTFGNSFETYALIIGIYYWNRISPKEKGAIDWNVVRVTCLIVASGVIRGSSALSWLPLLVSSAVT